jgi:acetylornithine/succinyldiaminopimelate/putrescine aminotransferase
MKCGRLRPNGPHVRAPAFHGCFGRVLEPDIMTLGKAIGGGLPVGVMWAKPDIAKLLVPGKHGSTLGANLNCMAAGRTVLDVIERERLTDHAAKLGEHAASRIRFQRED